LIFFFFVKSNEEEDFSSVKSNGEDDFSLVKSGEEEIMKLWDGVFNIAANASQLFVNKVLDPSSYESTDETIERAIKIGCWSNGIVGFLSSFGGVFTLPVAIGGSMLSQLIMVNSIALIRGYDVSNPDVQTMIKVVLLGDVGTEGLKKVGAEGTKLAANKIITTLGARGTLRSLNRAVGMGLVTRAGQKSFTQSLGRSIPIISGVVGATLDYYMCDWIAKEANKEIFGAAVIETHITEWNPDDVSLWLSNINLPHLCSKFREEKIRGTDLIAFHSGTLNLRREMRMTLGDSGLLKHEIEIILQ